MQHALGRITAVLGPTNTGKTHYAIERMLAHRTGVIGLPLRLLAREVYDRIVALRGPSVVALVTGEERIVPPRAAWWVATVEAMPEGIGPDFLAVDEIQLCADPERGHVFTDRLLHARGRHETLLLGAETMRGAIAALVPGVQFLRRERFSDLAYSGSKKISRMPARSAIVGFSVENVYAIAEVIRRQRGGAAVVMGALSPRTRNAQVELYQSGEVDFMVATDAIGMGLNLDIGHVAFSGLSKFDGRRMRALMPNELAQIAGRAGRYRTAGTFGVTGEAPPIPDEVVAAICDHRFAPIRKLQWRSTDLDFGTPDRLIAALEAPTSDDWLTRTRESDDLGALKALSVMAEVRARASSPAAVKLLWDVCRIPDFRGISHAEHATLLAAIFGHLHETGSVPDAFMARQVHRIDRTDGDIDALSKRLAYIRTWTYVAQRAGWTADEARWRDETRAVEDRLSDALHGALTLRFVDRRTSVLLRRLKQREAMVAEVNDKGEVSVEGQHVGRIEGFRFRQDATATPDEARTLRQASAAALVPQFNLRADRFYNAPDTEIDVTEQGGLMWGDAAVGKLVPGTEPLKPGIQVFVDAEAGEEAAAKVERRLRHYLDRRIAALFEPLMALSRDEGLPPLARGFAFRMVEHFGIIPRADVAQEVKDLDQEARGSLRKHGIRFGQFTIFLPALLKPAPTRLRLVLWALARGLDEFPESPPPGLVTVPSAAGAPDGYATMAGYRAAGERAIRIDMLERLADMIRAENTRGGFEARPDMLSITGMTLEQFADLMRGLGYRAERGERAKVRPADATGTEAPARADAAGTETSLPDGSAASGLAADRTADEAAAPDAPAGADGATDVGAAATVAPGHDGSATDAPAADQPTAGASGGDPIGTAPDGASAAPETETFYTFTWAPPRPRREAPQRRAQGGDGAAPGGRASSGGASPGGAPAGKAPGRTGPPRGKSGGKSGGKPGAKRDPKPQVYQARPERSSDRIDPDNPFAALLALKKD